MEHKLIIIIETFLDILSSVPLSGAWLKFAPKELMPCDKLTTLYINKLLSKYILNDGIENYKYICILFILVFCDINFHDISYKVMVPPRETLNFHFVLPNSIYGIIHTCNTIHVRWDFINPRHSPKCYNCQAQLGPMEINGRTVLPFRPFLTDQ